MADVATRSGMRLSAEERRRDVLHAAVACFAENGYSGTSTDEIAKRAGISQPYLFRLFGTKKALFLATIDLGFQLIEQHFNTAADGLEGAEALKAMGESYLAYLENRDLLQLQLHSYAASGDPEIRAAVAGRFKELEEFVSERTGATQTALGRFFAIGMLLNVTAALDLDDLRDVCATFALEES